MSESVFVDKDHNVLVGQEAKEALLKESDKCYFDGSSGKGVSRVSLGRWKIAQAYERKVWMEKGLAATNDRNLDYVPAFNKYRDLKGLKFDRAIELGSGPFTNLRLISWLCKIGRCSLLDPLVEQYLEHPNCYYNREFLFRDPRFLMVSLATRRIGRIIYKTLVPKRIYGKIPIQQIIPKPIEEMPPQAKYDLIVMINVLEHCYDVSLVFEKIASIAREGTCFVFRDKYYDHAKIAEDIETIYDAGHPLRVERRVIDDFLSTRYISIFRTVQKVRFSVGGIDRSYDAINFIGKFIG